MRSWGYFKGGGGGGGDDGGVGWELEGVRVG